MKTLMTKFLLTITIIVGGAVFASDDKSPKEEKPKAEVKQPATEPEAAPQAVPAPPAQTKVEAKNESLPASTLHRIVDQKTHYVKCTYTAQFQNGFSSVASSGTREGYESLGTILSAACSDCLGSGVPSCRLSGCSAVEFTYDNGVPTQSSGPLKIILDETIDTSCPQAEETARVQKDSRVVLVPIAVKGKPQTPTKNPQGQRPGVGRGFERETYGPNLRTYEYHYESNSQGGIPSFYPPRRGGFWVPPVPRGMPPGFFEDPWFRY